MLAVLKTAALLIAATVPHAPAELAREADLVVLNHTAYSDGTPYTRLVVIAKGRIRATYYQPLWLDGNKQEADWFRVCEAGEVVLVTATDFNGRPVSWRAKRYVELRSRDTNWTKRYTWSTQ